MTVRISALLVALLATLAPAVNAGEGKSCNAAPKKCAEQIREMLSTTRYLGIRIREGRWGVEIESVAPDSPASRAGIVANDRVLAVNNTDCSRYTLEQFKSVLGEAKKTGRVTMSVARGGVIHVVYARVPQMTDEQIERIVQTHLRDAHRSGDHPESHQAGRVE